MKKIILFTDNLGSGGAQRQVANVAVLLKMAGYDVSVLVYQDVPFYKHVLDDNGVPLVLVKSDGTLSRMLRIRRYLNKSGADVVISFLAVPCFVACFSKFGHKKWKLITTERSAKLSTFTAKKFRFFNKFERFSDAKVGNSHNAIKMWQKYYPQYNDKYSVIYNHICVPDEFCNTEHEYLEDGKVKLTVAASFQTLKNPINVIKAFNLLSDEHKSRLEIDWYGKQEVTKCNTEVYDNAQILIKKFGLEECVHLYDETNEIYRIMSESDAVGLFSTVEGLPNTICEAMTIGRPVVMSKVSDYDVLVTDNGYLCDPESVESIKESLAKLIETPKEELERMGNASKEKAKELFSGEAITKQWIEIVERLSC